MWKIYTLIWLTYLFSFGAGVAALLLTVSFTRKQRKRFPIVRKLDGKQIHLVITVIVFSALAYSAHISKETVSTSLSFELSYGPGFSQAEKATSNGIEIELRQSAVEQIDKARDYFKSGERYFSDKKYREAAENYQESINVIPTLSAYLNLGLSLRYLSKYAEAEPVLREGLQLARRRDNRRFEGLFLLTLGGVLVLENKRTQADDALWRSLQILREVGNKTGEANAILVIGANAHLAGKPDEAFPRYHEALKLFQDVNNILGQANALGNIGNVHLDRFNLVEALATYQSALGKFREIDHPVGQVITLGNVGLVYNYQGKYQDALNTLQSGIEMAKQIENPEAQARLTCTVGEVYNHQGKFDDSLPLEEQALEIAEKFNFFNVQVYAHNRMADAYLGKGMLPKALEHAQTVLGISKNHQVYPYFQAEALNAFGEIYLQEKQTDNALRSFEEALSISNSAQITTPKLRSFRGIGMTYLALGRKEDALAHLRRAQEIYKKAGIDSLESRKLQEILYKLEQVSPPQRDSASGQNH